MTTPNEPNKARTIPLHIADQAVAACEAEIQKLKEENARLNYQVSNLMLQVNSPHPAVMRWSLACKERDDLKAEVERLTQNTDKLCKHGDLEIERLKAEVERLRKAGDDLGWAVHRLKERFWDADEEANKAVQAWNAAKEGKPSA